MSHATLPGAEVALPEPPHPEGAAAGPAGGDLPHIVTACNAIPRMCRRPWALVAVEVSVVLEEVPSDGHGSLG